MCLASTVKSGAKVARDLELIISSNTIKVGAPVAYSFILSTTSESIVEY